MQITHTHAVDTVLNSARREARSLNQPVVEPEHLLLALVNSPHGRVSSLLRRHHIDRDVLRTSLRAVLPYNEDPPIQSEPTLSQRTQRMVNYARVVARHLGDHQITTQALLISVLEEETPRLTRALREIEADPRPLLDELARRIPEVEH